ncbi:restriction endonuclease subunit S [Methanobrevibacter smithii]|uniref:restriction endonuclease subunit S n=2 Tax=Methanobrevibacter smithii TaxID=2173 RepID=UPI002F42B201
MRFSGFDDEWKTYKLKDLLHNKSSSISINQLDDNVGNYPLYGASGFLKCIDFYEMDSDYISIVKDGSGVGNISFHEKNTSVVNTSQYILPKENLNIHFIFYLLQTINLNKYKTGSTIPHIYFKDYSIEKVKIPKYDEQKKIGILLKNLDAKIEILDNKLQMCQNFKKYLMQQIFTQKLRFNFNDTWKTVKIKDIFDERSEKGFLDLELLSVTLNDGVIKRSEIESKDNSNENKSNYKYVLPGDIVYNSMRMWQGASGVSPYDGIVSPAYTILIPKNVYSKYFGYYFKTNEMVYQFKKYSQGLTSDTWNLKYPLISEIKIKIPSIEEQKEITNVFEIMDEKIKILQNNIDELTTFKKGLLQQMFVVRINWRCNFKLAKSPSFNKHLLILKNKIIFIIIK